MITMTGCRTSAEGQVIHDLLKWWISRYSTTVKDMKYLEDAVVRRPENPHCPVVMEAYHAQQQDKVDI
jgi:hypothetical protein